MFLEATCFENVIHFREVIYVKQCNAIKNYRCHPLH